MKNTFTNILIVIIGCLSLYLSFVYLIQVNEYFLMYTFPKVGSSFHIGVPVYAITLILLAILSKTIILGLIFSYCITLTMNTSINHQDKRWSRLIGLSAIIIILEFLGWTMPNVIANLGAIQYLFTREKLFIFINIIFFANLRFNQFSTNNYYKYNHFVIIGMFLLLSILTYTVMSDSEQLNNFKKRSYYYG